MIENTPDNKESDKDVEPYDVVIVGAGISGICSAHALRQAFPEKRFLILESLETFGGTWQIHKYPGTRSDSDLFTFGYGFKPWIGNPIATRQQILDYLGSVIADANLAPHTLAAISVLALVLPNYTTTILGPFYSSSQLIFIAVVSLVLYGTFILVQTVRHRDYFLPVVAEADEEVHAPPPSNQMASLSAALLLVCLGAVVLLAKALSPALEMAVASMGAPKTVVGIIIALVVLLPESIAAYHAARANRLQTSLNLALGSALASIGLTIPAVALVSLMTGWTLSLGIDAKSTVLLVLSLFVASLSLGTGRTTVMQGTVHLVIFAVYLFTAIVP